MFKIMFNKKTSAYACGDLEYDYIFLRQHETYLNDLFEHRGYIYAERIYDSLGVKWNPEWENLCRIYDGTPIKFKFTRIDDGYEVYIE